jgi:dipeptidyl aminopeptidase/acylaminoacyl peptidase
MQPAHSGAAVFRHKGLKMVGVLNRPAAPDRNKFPSVLFLHGLPGAEKNVDIQRLLLKKGVASFSPHFRGAWGSEGRYLVSDLPIQAAAALTFLRRQAFVDPKRVAVFGFSMGGWTALHLAARQKDLKAVAAAAPVGGPEMVGPGTRKRIMRLCRPLRVGSETAVSRDFVRAVREQDPAASAAKLSCPLLLVHGDKDDVVPFPVSRRLYAAARAPKRLVRARGAGHDFLDRRDWLSQLVSGWLDGRLRGA